MIGIRSRDSDNTLNQRAKYQNTPLHIMGIALTAVAIGMVLSAAIEYGSTNRDTLALMAAAGVCGAAGGGLWWRTTVGAVRSRDIFAAVGWTWVMITLFGALPFVFAGTFATPGVGFLEQVVNSIFESASGYSCTGSTVLLDFARPGRGMLMYRQGTQWYGGMGVVVLAVAVLPFLGVGGLSLIKAEAPGPSSDRLAPRVSETAKRLWLVYFIYTFAVALALFIVPGPSLYDSVAHAFTTAATGGFSPHAESVGYFNSPLVEAVLIVGMLIGAANFSLHWRAAHGDYKAHAKDSEFRTYMGYMVGFSLLVAVLLWADGAFSFPTSIRVGAFNVVSLGTSTGFGNATAVGSAGDYVQWVPSAQMLLLFAMLIGGSTGSTAGGIKVMRIQVLWGHALRAIRRTQHPRAVIPVRHGKVAVAEDIVAGMAGFFLLYIVIVVIGVGLVTGLGGNLDASIGAVATAMGGVGPAFGNAGPTASFADAFTQPARLVLAVLMLIGRLEILPMLLMFAGPWRSAERKIRKL